MDLSSSYLADEKGQIYQVTFNLQNRFYLGPMWQPWIDPNGKTYTNSMGLVLGYHGFSYSFDNTSKFRFKAIEGQIDFNPMGFDLTLFEFDMTHLQDTPLFWLTSFIGTPTRHDFFIDVGFALKVGRLQYHPLGSENYTNIECLNLYLATYFWQSQDMNNYLRLRFGPGFGFLYQEHAQSQKKYSINPKVALEGKFILSQSGRHNLDLGAELTAPYYFDATKGHKYYGEAYLSYEWIFLAISDQPISLFFKALGLYRDDIADAKHKHELKFLAGLNFSFGAPPLVPIISEKQIRKESELAH